MYCIFPFSVVSRNAFDHEYEWWHDGPGQELCVKLDYSDYNKIDIRVKQRGSMLKLLGCENVKVQGLKLFATEMHAESRDGIGYSNSFEDIVAEYPDEMRLLPATLKNSVLRYGKGIIKSMGDIIGGNNKKPSRCTFVNNLIEYAEKGVELTGCAGAGKLFFKRDNLKCVINHFLLY